MFKNLFKTKKMNLEEVVEEIRKFNKSIHLHFGSSGRYYTTTVHREDSKIVFSKDAKSIEELTDSLAEYLKTL